MSDLPDQTQADMADKAAEPENQLDGSAAVESPQTSASGMRFSVGIDLGTTHCVLSYADLGNIDDENSRRKLLLYRN